MHAISHSLAHRAPPATRTRVRWQPYNSIPSASSSSSSSFSASRSSPATYLNTPASSVTSSPLSQTPLCDTDHLRNTSLPSTTALLQTQKEYIPGANKNKFAVSLVDQAVKSLCDIWRPQDIPLVFNSAPRPTTTVGSPTDNTPRQQRFNPRNTQLPSPLSPSTNLTPPLSSSSLPQAPTTQALLQSGTDVRSYLVPIRGFVHEVLRRSRTSGCVLQTALCYLEAVRPKVPELLRQELEGVGVRGEPEPASQIIPATEAELRQEAELVLALDSIVETACGSDNIMDTIRVTDVLSEVHPEDGLYGQQRPKSPSPLLPPLPALPSPLLCPRRAFLAALILASKFTQDKCYSNRAWAKLSGLPPREIGRCERALGDALDWRLWVGKAPVTALPTSPLHAHRPVVRCQSEPSLNSPPATTSPVLARGELCSSNTTGYSETPTAKVTTSGRGLQRSSTLPAEAFAVPRLLDRRDQVWVRDPPSTHVAHQAVSSEYAGCRATYGEPPIQSSVIYPSTCSSDTPMSEKATPNSSPDMPGLSYSPSSTVSSSGERTIQMTTFLDDNMAPPFTESQSWPWMDVGDGVPGCGHAHALAHTNNKTFNPLASLPQVLGSSSTYSVCKTEALSQDDSTWGFPLTYGLS